MGHPRHERFIVANEELRGFQRRMDGLANGTESISEGDLRALLQRITNLSPEVGDASRGETLDANLQKEIAEYVRNFRALQITLEKVRCIVLVRKLLLDGATRFLEDAQSWANAHSQTI